MARALRARARGYLDASGNLSFAIRDALHSNAIMNGAILTATASAVPEPSTYAAILAAVALGATVLRRRNIQNSAARN